MKIIGRAVTFLFLTGFIARGDDSALADARAKFAKQDAELNTVYKEVAATLDKEQAADLLKRQRVWLGFRDARSESRHRFDTGQEVDDPKTTVEYWRAMADYTADRIAFLRIYSGKGLPPGISGEYTDAYDGSLTLKETGRGVAFHLLVVRGHTAHIGEISGVLHPKGGKAHFRGKADPGIDEPPCEMEFAFSAGHIVTIVQRTKDPDAGMGVSYDGDYFKTGKPAKP
jgi:uncharacterized protein YecT (DUF1311 family)